jgi:hypothetical protein
MANSVNLPIKEIDSTSQKNSPIVLAMTHTRCDQTRQNRSGQIVILVIVVLGFYAGTVIQISKEQAEIIKSELGKKKTRTLIV